MRAAVRPATRRAECSRRKESLDRGPAATETTRRPTPTVPRIVGTTRSVPGSGPDPVAAFVSRLERRAIAVDRPPEIRFLQRLVAGLLLGGPLAGHAGDPGGGKDFFARWPAASATRGRNSRALRPTIGRCFVRRRPSPKRHRQRESGARIADWQQGIEEKLNHRGTETQRTKIGMNDEELNHSDAEAQRSDEEPEAEKTKNDCHKKHKKGFRHPSHEPLAWSLTTVRPYFRGSREQSRSSCLCVSLPLRFHSVLRRFSASLCPVVHFLVFAE